MKSTHQPQPVHRVSCCKGRPPKHVVVAVGATVGNSVKPPTCDSVNEFNAYLEAGLSIMLGYVRTVTSTGCPIAFILPSSQSSTHCHAIVILLQDPCSINPDAARSIVPWLYLGGVRVFLAEQLSKTPAYLWANSGFGCGSIFVCAFLKPSVTPLFACSQESPTLMSCNTRGPSL